MASANSYICRPFDSGPIKSDFVSILDAGVSVVDTGTQGDETPAVREIIIWIFVFTPGIRRVQTLFRVPALFLYC